MKFHGIEMKGRHIVQKVSANPSWSAGDEGRIIFNTTDNKFYQATNAAWAEVGGGSVGTTYYYLPESNGSVLWDDCSNINYWTDNDTGAGASTQVTQDGKSCFKLDSGATTSNSEAQRTISGLTGLSTRAVCTIRMYHFSGGTYANNDYFRVLFYYTNTKLIQIMFASEAVYYYNGSSAILLPGIRYSDMSVWSTWTFDVNVATGIADIYADGRLVSSGVCGSMNHASTPGVSVTQNGRTNANRISYVDYIAMGSDFIKVSPNSLAGPSIYGVGNTPFIPAGYAAGGVNATTSFTTINKLNFSNDSCSVITSGLSAIIYAGGGFQSATAGYAAEGSISTTYVSTINKLTFSNDNTSSITSGLVVGKGYTGSGFNSSSAGYIAGGYSTTYVSTIDKLTFSNDNNSAITSGLSSARFASAGFNSNVAGYTAGGSTNATGLTVAGIDKLTFSTDANSAIGSSLSTSRRAMAGFESSVAGYTTGGTNHQQNPFTFVSTIDKLYFTNDNTATVASGLSSIRSAGMCFNSTISGYTAGGVNPTPTYYSTIDKLTFSTDSNVAITSGLNTALQQGSGFNTL